MLILASRRRQAMLVSMPPASPDRRPRSRALLPAWYHAILADQRASGLSVAEFAEVAGLSPDTLSRWRHRLAQQEDRKRQTAARC
jgi:hypothetical protein